VVDTPTSQDRRPIPRPEIRFPDMDASTRFNLEGRTALVTGAARGIGAGVALALSQHGADIILLDRVEEDAAKSSIAAVRKSGRQAWYVQQDLADLEALSAVVDQLWKMTGRIDILVNNAGAVYLEHFDQITLDHWRHVLTVNADATFFLAQHVAVRMIEASVRGRIINTSSVNGLVAEAGLAHYNASKGALEMITQSLAIELGPHGITANSVCPGVIETEIADDFAMDEAFESHVCDHIPLEHRLGKVDDCTGAYVFLASEAGRYVTGQHIVVDGGILCEQMPRMAFMNPSRTPRG